jgi:hypothetical protein
MDVGDVLWIERTIIGDLVMIAMDMISTRIH